MPLTDRDLYRCFDTLLSAAAPVPAADLAPGERASLAGYCFPEDAAVVYAVARALRDAPDLYRDVLARVDPDGMVDRFERGRAFYRLGRLLQDLARGAMDAYLRDQAATVKDALSVLEQVRTTGRLPHPPADQARRVDRMRLARRAIDRGTERRRQAARNGRRRASP